MCLELSEEKMGIKHRVSLMTGRHLWLERTICFHLVDQSICVLVIAGWRSRREDFEAQLMVTTSNHELVNMADFWR